MFRSVYCYSYWFYSRTVINQQQIILCFSLLFQYAHLASDAIRTQIYSNLSLYLQITPSRLTYFNTFNSFREFPDMLICRDTPGVHPPIAQPIGGVFLRLFEGGVKPATPAMSQYNTIVLVLCVHTSLCPFNHPATLTGQRTTTATHQAVVP